MLDKLIEEGERVKKTCSKDNCIGGEDYEKWIAKCILYMEKEHKGESLTKRFLEAAERAVNNYESFYDTMMGILKACKEFENRA